MNLSIADTKEIVTRISSTRSIRTGNSDRTQDVLSHNVRDATAAPASISDNQPACGSKVVKAGTVLDSEFSNIDVGRSRRFKKLQRRIRSSGISTSDRMKQTNYVTTYFSNKQFSGDLSQSISLVIRDYKHCATLYELDDSAMATNFASCLRDPARAFFLSNVREGMTFNEIEKFMLDEYNSPSRQIKIRRRLESIQIQSVMAEHNFKSEQYALSLIIKTINTLVPQCPPAFRSEDNKIGFLRQAVIREIWAKPAISKVDAGGISWCQFTTDLHAALSLHQEVEQEVPRHTHISRKLHNQVEDTLYTRYGKDPRLTRKPGRTISHRKERKSGQYPCNFEQRQISFDEARKRGICVRCSEPWSKGHRCNGRNVRDRVYQRLTDGEHYTHVISELISALETSWPEDDELITDGEESDAVLDTCMIEEILEKNRPSQDKNDQISAIHYLSAAFIRPSNSACTSIQARGSADAVLTCPNEFKTEVTRNYLVKEASSVTEPGFLVDIGAPRSVVGKHILTRILSQSGLKTYPKRHPSSNRFRFAYEVFDSIGTIVLYLKTPNGIEPIPVEIDIIIPDIPPLLGLDVLDRERLTPDIAYNVLAKRQKITRKDGTVVYVEEWGIPMWRAASRHSYVPMSVTIPIYFTRNQLHKLHRQFFHPSAEKLYNLLRRSRPEDTTPETKKILKDITRRCDPCQRIRRGPTRFKVSLGAEEVRFNERILMDIMYIDRSPVLHVVDDETKFSAAAWLPDASSKTIWTTFLLCWATIYTGLPNRVMVDQGSALGKSSIFASLVEDSNIKFEKTSIESHSSLGIGERYHEPLRTTYRKLEQVYPGRDKRLLLQCAVKGMNDTLGPEGIVPSVLVFGEYPPVHTPSEKRTCRPETGERANIANDARIEMAKHMAKARVARALKNKAPTALDSTFNPGDQVLVWRENVVNNRIGEWLGPFVVNSFDPATKLVHVRWRKNNEIKPFNLAQVRRYNTPEFTAFSFLNDINDRLSYFRNPSIDCHATEVINGSDPRASDPRMKEAIKKEVKGLFERDV